MDEADSVTNSDSGFGGTHITSASVSVTSSNYRWRHREGRTYHAFDDNPYPFPADESEGYRLDSLHDLNKILFHKNVLAPIEDLPGTRIEDLGTGSGKWAIEVADEYANALVRGIDLAPIQPTYLPLNCSFYVGDITKDLDDQMYPDGSIDLVHMRHVHSGIKSEEWPTLLRNVYRMLKPGNGWIQVGEIGRSATSANPPSSCILWQFAEYHRQIQQQNGTSYLSTEEQVQLVEDAGFIDIQIFQKWCDHGTYTQDPESRRAGLISRYAHGALYPTLAKGFTQIEDVEERRAFGERAVAALCSGAEPYATLRHQIVARKPPVQLGSKLPK